MFYHALPLGLGNRDNFFKGSFFLLFIRFYFLFFIFYKGKKNKPFVPIETKKRKEKKRHKFQILGYHHQDIKLHGIISNCANEDLEE